jgi:signal transduction histidine kinase
MRMPPTPVTTSVGTPRTHPGSNPVKADALVTRTRLRPARDAVAPGAEPALVDVESRERFSAYVAHELRTPIAVQRALVEVTLADPNADVTALREMGERVLACCMRQQRLTEALLDLGRSRRGLTRQEPVDIAALAATTLQEHDLTGLGTVVALERVRASGDPDLLELLAANLVSNAIHHNVVGGTIEVATRGRLGQAVLRVANTGPIIAPDELRQLFRPYRRLAHGPDTRGTGLGLAIVQAIVQAHRATMTARARASGGLEIQVCFRALE